MKRIVAIFCALIPSSAFAVPPPPELLTTDCVNPSYAIDVLVCADEELLALDHFLLGLIETRDSPLADGIESDEAWFRRSRLCAFEEYQRTCLLSAYCERLVVLKGIRSGGETDLDRVASICS